MTFSARACISQVDSADNPESSEAEETEDSIFWEGVTKPTAFKSLSASQKEQEVRKRPLIFHQSVVCVHIPLKFNIVLFTQEADESLSSLTDNEVIDDGDEGKWPPSFSTLHLNNHLWFALLVKTVSHVMNFLPLYHDF